MKKKLLSGLGTIIAFLIIAGFKMGSHTNAQCPFPVEIDGNTILVNKVTVGDLEKLGYKLSDSTLYQLVKEIDKKTYADHAASINKDNKIYADISVINKSGSSKKISECKVFEMRFFYSDQFCMGKKKESYKEAVIDGFNPSGMTKDEVKAKVTKDIKEEKDKELTIEDENYYCTYSFDDNGIVDSVEVGIPVSDIDAF